MHDLLLLVILNLPKIRKIGKYLRIYVMNIHDKIANHPSNKLQDDIRVLCNPLNTLGITYFSKATILEDKFSGISNNPEFQKIYLINNYQNADIHMANRDIHQKYFIWDEINYSGKSLELDDKSIDFGINHTFTIHQKDDLGDHFFHFATENRDKNFNHVYLRNIDLLEMFINKFNQAVKDSSELSKTYSITFAIDENVSHFDFSNTFNLNVSEHIRYEFLNELCKDKKFPINNTTSLSMRQLILLYWLYHGKTINDISRILNLAEVTVHKQINQLKIRANCYTQFQLGVFFAKLALNHNEVAMLIGETKLL